MKNTAIIILLALTFASSEILSQNIAKVCMSSGRCFEVTRVRIDGNWTNACCQNVDENVPIPSDGSCTDDCGSSIQQPDNSFENEQFPMLPSNFTLPSGNKVWIYKNDELLSTQLDHNDPEYIYMNNVNNDFDFYNHYVGLEFAAFIIDSNTVGIIDNLNAP